MHRSAVFATMILAGACAPKQGARDPQNPQDAFFGAIAAHCGKAYEGRLASDDPRDADMAGQRLVMEVRSCTESQLRVPFHVGEDRSRTWVITKTGEGLRLKHDHRHEDGSEDAVTQYGGDTVAPGTEERQEFPVDAYSIEMFQREDLSASVTNIWAVEITPAAYVYELRREGRHFRVEFNLTEPVENPPAPWGQE